MTTGPTDPHDPPVRAPARATYRSVFARGETRVLFGTVLLYGLGFQFEILGLAVLVYDRTASPLLSALAFGIGFLPQVVGGALLTSLADHVPARTLVATCLVVRAAPGVAIGLLPGMPIAVMLLAVAVAGALTPVFTAAAAGLLPELLHGDDYVLGRSILSLTSSGTQILGLGIGGGVLAVVAAPDLVLLAGAALLLAAALARAGLRTRAVSGTVRTAGVVRTTLSGNARLLADTRVRSLLLAQWLPAWFVTGAESLIVPYVGSLGRPAGTASALLVALPAGMIAGDLVLGRLCPPGLRRRLTFPLALVLGCPLLVFVLTPPVPVAAGLLVVSGLGFGYQLGIQQPFLDSVPDGLRGQAFGLNATGLMGGQGLLPPVVGAAAGLLGVAGAMAGAGAATVVTVVALRRALTGR